MRNKHKKVNINQSEIANKEPIDVNKNNPGLDADGSSEEKGKLGYLNNDNDRISGNPDGENDRDLDEEHIGHSPLLDK